MPVYEYCCNDCRRKVSLYIKSFSNMPKAICSYCGSENLTRLFSTFAVHKTDKDIYDEMLSNSQLVERMLANDPRALAEWTRKMDVTGETSPQSEEVLERLERGERWEKIITEMQERELAKSSESEE